MSQKLVCTLFNSFLQNYPWMV